MSTGIILNHHAAATFPYCMGEDGIEFLVEIKDRKFRPPFFDGGANGIGGNNIGTRDREGRPIEDDDSPLGILTREIYDEFHIKPPSQIEERPLHERLSPVDPAILDRYSGDVLSDIRVIGHAIIDGISHGRDLSMTVYRPILRNDITYILSFYLSRFDPQMMKHVKEMLEKIGPLTTDNINYGHEGHSLEILKIKDVNVGNRKFAWGYDRVLTRMLELYGKEIGASEEEQRGVIRPLRFIDLRDLEHAPLGSLTAYEQQGFVYANRSA